MLGIRFKMFYFFNSVNCIINLEKVLQNVIADTVNLSLRSDYKLFFATGWLVVCFGFNSPLRQFLSISSRLPKRGRKRRERIKESKNDQTTPTRTTYCERSRPLPYCIQIVGCPGTGSLPSTTAPPDHPLLQQNLSAQEFLFFHSL